MDNKHFMGLDYLVGRATELNILQSILFLVSLILIQFILFYAISNIKGIDSYLNKIVLNRKFIPMFLVMLWILMQMILILINNGGYSGGYDENTQKMFEQGEIEGFDTFIKNSDHGGVLVRYPVASIFYIGLWLLTQHTIFVKFFFAVFNLCSATIFYCLIMKITRSSLMSFICAALFIIIPITFYASHELTFRMSHNQTGLFFLMVSLLMIVRFCESFKNRYLLLTLLFHLLATLSYEVFLGFLIVYPIIVKFRRSFHLGTSVPLAAYCNLRLKFMLFVFVDIIIIAMYKPIGHLIYKYYFGYNYQNYQMGLLTWIANWKLFMIGNGGEWGPVGVLHFICDFPVYFARLHVNIFLNVFSAPTYIVMPYLIILAVMNILFLYYYKSIGYDKNLKNNDSLSLFLLGILFFFAAIITPLVTIGQIWERYMYCGYFGLIIVYVVIIVKMNNLSLFSNKFRICLTSLALLFILNLFELLNISRVFQWKYIENWSTANGLEQLLK
jgi:hypothetical protein